MVISVGLRVADAPADTPVARGVTNATKPDGRPRMRAERHVGNTCPQCGHSMRLVSTDLVVRFVQQREVQTDAQRSSATAAMAGDAS